MDISGIIPQIFENFLKLLPFRFRIINSYQQGVKFSFGKDIKKLTHTDGIPIIKFSKKFPWVQFERTGLYFYWAWVQNIYILDSVPIVVETQYQTVKTADDKDVTISAGITYSIEDARSYWTSVQDFEHSIENIVQTAIAEYIISKNLLDIRQNYKNISKEILKILKKRIEGWGVNVKMVNIINFTTSRSLRLLQNGNNNLETSNGES